ncbi:MAG: alpha/beta fold hydrolase [Halobacteriales archaeon]
MATDGTTPIVEICRTDRLSVRYRRLGDPDGEAVVLVHGNVSSARFWEPMAQSLPPGLDVLAPDLRGYGGTERRPVDATRGLRPFAEDLHAFLEALGVADPALVGWSLGGGVSMRYAIERPTAVRALALINPVSPYGFGGTRRDGTPCQPDCAGTGAGLTNDAFVESLSAGERGADAPTDPRSVLREYYVADADGLDPHHEDAYVDGMLEMATGEDHYPGDVRPSEHWPGVAPGTRGVNNAISPRYCDLTAIADIAPKPPMLWLRGDADRIVSDRSHFDAGTLGQLGQLPEYPGEEVFPPQPMVTQTADVLETYADAGGTLEQAVLEGTGHGPHLERPGAVAETLAAFLG